MHHFTEGNPYKRSNAWGRIAEDTIFKKWILKKRYTIEQVAKLLGTSTRSVKYWMAGQTLPGLLHAFKIQQISEGKVPVEAWLETAIAKAKWHTVGVSNNG